MNSVHDIVLCLSCTASKGVSRGQQYFVHSDQPVVTETRWGEGDGHIKRERGWLGVQWVLKLMADDIKTVDESGSMFCTLGELSLVLVGLYSNL